MRDIIYRGGSYRALSDKDIENIHDTSIKILTRVGFEISFPPALELLQKHGAAVDYSKNRVYLTREIISRCIKQAPAEFTFYGLEEGKEIVLGGKRVHFGTGGKALYVLDRNRKRRPAVLQDIENFGRLADKLEYVDFFIIPTHPHDININSIDINEFYHALRSTGKPVMGGVFSKEGLEKVIEMASIIAGSPEELRRRPFVGFITAITSPLKIEDDRADILIETAKHGLPLVTSTAPIAGATAPVTLAGTLALQNAEALMGVILSQLANPGTPVFYSAVPCTMDMRSGSFLMGSIESGLMNAAVTQMAHYYRLPCYVTVGVADSKIPDAQAAYESAATCMLAALAGGNFIHQAFGFLDGALTISYGQFVIDNDIVGSCLRTLRGIETNPETLAFDVIASVGPGGNFLAQKHTVEYMRTESYRPRVSNYQDYQSWLNAGGKDSWEKAEEIVSKLLSEPPRQFIPEEIDEQIRSRFPELVEPTKAS